MNITRLQLGDPVDYGSYAIEKRLSKLGDHISFADKKVLDIGCGNGAYTLEIAKASSVTIGIDIEIGRLKAFKIKKEKDRIKNAFIIQMSGEQLGFQNDIFDVIILIETLEHINDERKCLEECRRVLKPGGKIALYVPNRMHPFETHGIKLGVLTKYTRRIPFISWLPSKILKKISFVRSYKAKEIIKLLETEGFNIEILNWFYPPLDNLRLPKYLKLFYRKYLCRYLEISPFRVFGVSILVIGEKHGVKSKSDYSA
ncbi:MAG: class I SAM-dependent methyltransferase [Thermodesulfobacteriota bacterium]